MAMSSMDHDRRNKHPRMLTDPERERLDEFIDSIHYSSRYVLTRNSYFSTDLFSESYLAYEC